ncbi:TRAP transporter substrate-binding protein DctP [Niallia endozanthoxylica]|uniref:Uncharacterized protein n=1 Tax=Niallia endozanthoxylica TaxID=2036016 RepID=A0A5J5I973_9BACI|nr:TRAP transporter substrate-binding protein DctP [Niallia endozanthoxylica]KAA9032375.1 hypothetical protein F4V44_00220 [Niallia endozanthoxylica]
MKKLFSRLAVVSAVCMLAACSSNSSSSSSESSGGSGDAITINAVSFLAKDDPLIEPVNEYIKLVEEKSDGQITINWRGGADIIPVGEQANAVQTGVIDMVFGHTGQYESQNRAVQAMPLSKLQPWEERENGFYEAMLEEHKEIDMIYIGRWLNTSPQIWLNKPIESLADLKGTKIRATGNYTRFFESLGINAVMIDPSEVYTSLQTGVVEGFVFGGISGPHKNGWTDSTKYVLDHPFWNSNTSIVMNPDKWDGLSEENQQALIAAVEEFERYMVDFHTKAEEKEREVLAEADVEFITLPEADAKELTDKAYDVEWDYLKTEIPDEVDNLRKLSE